MSCVDPATEVINTAVAAMARRFDPDQECPPHAGGSTEVRFLPGADGFPVWATIHDDRCDPLLWVRVVQRYRSTPTEFPAVVEESVQRCATGAFNVLEIAVGVTRCSVMDTDIQHVDWATIADEAAASLDDSWRVQQALCDIRLLQSKSRAVNTANVACAGPEGGYITWAGVAQVQIAKG